MIPFKTYKTEYEEILYVGEPNLSMLDSLAKGPGDLWHSSLTQGYKNCLPQLVYQSAVFWWYLNDVEQQTSSVNWRVNIEAFAIRRSVWQDVGGIRNALQNKALTGIDFGFNFLRNLGGIPLYVEGLYEQTSNEIQICNTDRYVFYLRNFKKKHSRYMLFRQHPFRFPNEFAAYKKALKVKTEKSNKVVRPRDLKPIEGKPTVSLVIPTMKRQAFTEVLLEDHNKQTYLIKEAIIVDATPENERNSKYYRQDKFKFEIKLKWQTSKGSCRARNEAIEMCSGDYIIFADDDIRILPDFVENHIRLLQTYKAKACNGLDIMAEHTNQDLTDLKDRLNDLGDKRWKVGVSHMFSNANSCVSRSLVEALIGNDINFDGGYGEDTDFGHRIIKEGEVLLHNPFSPNLHLKPPSGGYRFWGSQSKVLGKSRQPQPWELGRPIKFVKPKPSPTMTYLYMKHFTALQLREWSYRYFFMYLFSGDILRMPFRFFKAPLRFLQFKTSVKYAKRLLALGPRYN